MNSTEMQQPTTAANVMTAWRIRLLVFTGFIVAVAALAPIVTHEFVDWDDSHMLALNPRLNPPTVRSVLGYALPKNAELHLYIPLTEFFWGGLAAIAYVGAADVNGTHLNPWVFHLASVSLHLATAVIVFLSLRRLLPAIGWRQWLWPAWTGAMIFAVHPVQVEAIAWASGFKDVLAGFFACASIYCLLRHREAGERSKAWIVFCFCCVMLANLSKAGAIATPLGLLVIDCVILRTTPSRSVKLLWPFFVAMLPIYALAKSVQPVGWIDIKPLAFALRPFIAGDALAFYTSKILWPFGFSFDYGRTPPVALTQWITFADWLIPLSVIVLSCRARQNRLLLGGLCFAIAAVSPVLGFVEFGSQDFSTVADHYMYPALFGIAMMGAWGVARFDRVIVKLLAVVIVLFLGARTIAVGADWQDSETLCRHALELNPYAWNALDGLGVVLKRKGDLAGAEDCFLQSEQINPRNGSTHLNLAYLYVDQRRLNQAIDEFRDVTKYFQLESRSDQQTALGAQLVIAKIMLKHHRLVDAIEACQAALSIDPHQPEALQMLHQARQMSDDPTSRETP